MDGQGTPSQARGQRAVPTEGEQERGQGSTRSGSNANQVKGRNGGGGGGGWPATDATPEPRGEQREGGGGGGGGGGRGLLPPGPPLKDSRTPRVASDQRWPVEIWKSVWIGAIWMIHSSPNLHDALEEDLCFTATATFHHNYREATLAQNLSL